MDPVLVLLRLVHVVLGVFWAGTLVFTAVFLAPAIRDAGPDGANVMGALMRRRFFDVMPVVAALTIVSGLWLYWQASRGLRSVYVTSGRGLAFGLGGLASIVAFAIGLSIMRPAMTRAAALMQSPDREAQQATIQALRQRAASAGRIVALLLGLAVAGMAVGRYV